MATPTTAEARTGSTIVLLRWVLIIATSYLVLFSRPLAQTPPVVGLFVAAYLGSNLFLPWLRTQHAHRSFLDGAVVLFDIAAVSIGLVLTGNGSADFFPVYFLVVFLGALTQRLALVVGAAVLISIVNLSTVSQFVTFGRMMAEGYILRIPFLFAVALFFGYQVQLLRRRERNERARRRKRLRAEFISSVTHDLKNPVSVIQSLSELLLEGDAGALNGEQAEITRRIHASARHVIQLSVNLLDAARLDSGHLELQRAPVSLVDVVEHALVLARSASDLKGIRLELACSVPPPSMDIDALQIERVVSNLLDNAIKYTPVGGVVTVSLDPHPGEVELRVTDTGRGIPPEDVTSIFEKYRRRAANSAIPGSGLGLFIVQAIVQAHGGSVLAQSTLGHGTTVTVRLPTVRLEASPMPAVAPAMAYPRWRLSWRSGS